MSVSSIQYNRKKKQYIKDLVKQGVKPNNYELSAMLVEHFDNHTLGLPYYSPREQEPYGESSKEDYNHNFMTLNEDMETIYDANVECSNSAIAVQEYYDTERIKVANAIKRTSLRVDNLFDAVTHRSRTKEFVDAFEDLYNVEFYGNVEKNIPYTTAFVDLLQRRVYTDKSSSQRNTLLISTADITLDKSKFSSFESKGELKTVLTDTVNDYYIFRGFSSTDEENKITLTVDLKKLMTFNSVWFSYITIKDIQCKLWLSNDSGKNWVQVNDESNNEHIEWNFYPKSADKIKIECIKSEPDGSIYSENTDGYMYEYDYIFKNISIAYDDFQETSTFVTKPIELGGLFSEIKIDVKDMIFHGTRIDYFIGFDNGTNKVGWDVIHNHKPHKLFMFQKIHKMCNWHNGIFGEADDTNKLFKICRLPKGINTNSVKVAPGYNMWEVRRYNRNKPGEVDEFGNDISGDSYSTALNLETGDFSDYVKDCILTTRFMDCEKYDSYEIWPNVLYIFTQFVNVKETENIYDRKIKLVAAPDSAERLEYIEEKGRCIRIFVNGIEITAVNGENYSFHLKKGTNKIQIAISYASEKADAVYLSHNINFKQATNDVFACRPMKYATPLVLSKFAYASYEYYTIYNDYICVKPDPQEMISSKMDDMGYFVTYYELRSDMKQYFKDGNIKFRLMAVLNSNDRNLSPEIENYRITGI